MGRPEHLIRKGGNGFVTFDARPEVLAGTVWILTTKADWFLRPNVAGQRLLQAVPAL